MFKYKARPGVNGCEPQSLRSHILGVVKKTSSFASESPNGVKYNNISKLCAYTHDLVKSTEVWQNYCPDKEEDTLTDRKKIDHATGGILWLNSKYDLRNRCPLLFEVVAMVNVSHHSGLMNTDYTDSGVNSLKNRLNSYSRTDEFKDIDKFVIDSKLSKGIDEAVEGAINDIKHLTEFMTSKRYTADEIKFTISMLIKMVFSCLVDADHQDAYDYQQSCQPSYYKAKKKYTELHSGRVKKPTKWMLDKLNAHYRDNILPNVGRYPINGMRNEYRDIVLSNATLPRGFFRLYGPTGIGKNLTNINFSLIHARTHNMSRIIIASPFEAIIEQNAKVHHDLFDSDGKQAVLEIHSTYDYSDKESKERRVYRLSKENHDCAIVHTSFVRIFDSFLKNKGKCNRMLHSLANSVIILDECQELYINYLRYESNILKVLVEQYGCTVILCSATIPSIHHDNLLHTRNQMTNIIKNPIEFESRLNELRKVIYDISGIRTPMSVSEVGNRLIASTNEHGNALCILSTRKAVSKVYDYVQANAKDTIVIHLSTYMCPVHRFDVIAKIRGYLDAGIKVCVICTRLIEAGVDIDFKCVYKSVASIPSILQAAGRNNRNGAGVGYFYLIQLVDDIESTVSMISLEREKAVTMALLHKSGIAIDYSLSVDFADRLLQLYNDNIDIIDSNGVYQQLGVFTDADKRGYNDIRNDGIGFTYPFRDINDFNLIDHIQTHVIVPYNDEARELITYLKDNPPQAYHHKIIQKYTVGVFSVEPYGGYINSVTYTDSGIDDDSTTTFRFADSVIYNNDVGLVNPQEINIVPF